MAYKGAWPLNVFVKGYRKRNKTKELFLKKQ